MLLTNKTASSGESLHRFYLGIDSGGTNTRAMLADHTGTVWGTGHSGSANPNHYPRQQVAENLHLAISAALSGCPKSLLISTIFMGSSGISTVCDRDDMCAVLRSLPEVGPNTQVAVESDTVIGLTGGLAGRPGIVLIAGTGSACYGINAQGESYLCGGWGAVADDVGSAPWIGTRAIQAAVFAADGRIPPTSLRNIVFDFLELAEPRQLIHRLHNQGVDRANIGCLAPFVLEACASGDAAASEIVADAISGLALLVRVTKDRLFCDSQCEMILVGGLALSGPPFQPMLIQRIQETTSGVLIRKPELSPVQGAILEAMKLDGIAWSNEILENLNSGALRNIHA